MAAADAVVVFAMVVFSCSDGLCSGSGPCSGTSGVPDALPRVDPESEGIGCAPCPTYGCIRFNKPECSPECSAIDLLILENFKLDTCWL